MISFMSREINLKDESEIILTVFLKSVESSGNAFLTKINKHVEKFVKLKGKVLFGFEILSSQRNP